MQAASIVVIACLFVTRSIKPTLLPWGQWTTERIRIRRPSTVMIGRGAFVKPLGSFMRLSLGTVLNKLLGRSDIKTSMIYAKAGNAIKRKAIEGGILWTW